MEIIVLGSQINTKHLNTLFYVTLCKFLQSTNIPINALPNTTHLTCRSLFVN